jgi:hypothetical protein
MPPRHHSLLDDRCAVAFGVTADGVELLGAGRLHTDVMQTRPGGLEELGVDAVAVHRRDDLELHVACVT